MDQPDDGRVEVDYKSLYEAVRDQRNQLADREAMLTAAIAVLRRQIQDKP